jgi:thiopeptide-type bacteriocin biosynthesis protein
LGGLQDAALFEAVHGWRVQRGIPRYARLADYDNELLVDFDNVLSVESFVQLIKDRDEARLVEAFPGPDDLCVTGPEGRSFHELSIPFLRDRPSPARDLPPVPKGTRAASGPVLIDQAGPVDGATAEDDGMATSESLHPLASPRATPRRFAPGSEWLFAKLYTGPAMVDGLLRNVVRPLVDRALGSGAADAWFFVRYGDPEWHLRLRLHGDPARLHGDLLPLLNEAVAPLLASGQVRTLTLDTYERELERYGGPIGMLLCEGLFQADSTAVLEVIDALDDVSLAGSRWKLAVAGMDVLLNGLGLGLAERLVVTAAVRDGLAREHGADQKLLRQIGERFRVERAGVEALLDPSAPASADVGGVASATAALRRLAHRVGPIMARLRAAAERGELSTPLSAIAPSLLHMHANRLLRSDQRRQEMVLYDFLYRLYDAQAARARSAATA